jgi:hypothetical protein
MTMQPTANGPAPRWSRAGLVGRLEMVEEPFRRTDSPLSRQRLPVCPLRTVCGQVVTELLPRATQARLGGDNTCYGQLCASIVSDVRFYRLIVSLIIRSAAPPSGPRAWRGAQE